MLIYKFVLFDLDGTLSDPKIGITNSINFALAKMKREKQSIDFLQKFIGPLLINTFQDDFGMTKTEANIALTHYRECFAATGLYENFLYQGIDELLEELYLRKTKIILATSKPKYYAEKILVYFNIFKYFYVVEGSELNGERVDKTELIKYILETYKIDKNEAIMIGDRKHDIIGAKNNNIDSISVGYGYGSEGELADSKSTYNVKTVKELAKLLL